MAEIVFVLSSCSLSLMLYLLYFTYMHRGVGGGTEGERGGEE